MFYSSLAGKIEARDAAERRGLTKEQRRATLPALDEDAVFAEDVSWPVQFSAREAESAYAEAVERGDSKTAQLLVNDAARRAGYIPVSRWHQTAADFTKFSTDNPVAGLNDSETPNGIFFKTNDHDIGIGGNKQMRVFLNHKNLLHFRNREEASAWYSENVPGYGDLNRELKAKLDEFEPEFKAIEDEQFAPDTTDERVEELFELEDQLIARMGKVETEYRARLREMLNDYFLRGNSQYDGIELDYDGHRWVNGVKENVHTFIVFKPNQVKSAEPVTYDDAGNVIPLSERFNVGNEDIRYSVREVNGNKVVWLDEDVMAQNTSGKSVLAFIRDYIIDHLDDVYTIAESGYQVHPDRKLPDEYTRSEYTKQIANSRKLLRAKMRMVSGFGEMLEIATNRRWEPTKHKANKDAKYGVYKYTTRVAFDGKSGIEAYKAKLVILNASDGRKYLYDIEGIKKDVATATGLTQARKSSNAAQQQTNNVNNSIPQSSGAVNKKNQLSARDLPTDVISIREYLGSMEPTDRMTDTERDLLGRYQAHLKTLGEKEAAIAEQEEIIRTVPLRNEDGTINAELQKAKNRIRLLREQAARETRALNAAESSKGFARLMATSRQVVDTYLLGASRSVADAADALDAEVDALTERLKHQKGAHAAPLLLYS